MSYKKSKTKKINSKKKPSAKQAKLAVKNTVITTKKAVKQKAKPNLKIAKKSKLKTSTKLNKAKRPVEAKKIQPKAAKLKKAKLKRVKSTKQATKKAVLKKIEAKNSQKTAQLPTLVQDKADNQLKKAALVSKVSGQELTRSLTINASKFNPVVSNDNQQRNGVNVANGPRSFYTQRAAFASKLIADRKSAAKVKFKINDYAVYPSHGVGKIVDIEKVDMLGQSTSCYLMHFEKERLTVRIPVASANRVGLRHLVSQSQMEEVFLIIRSGIKKLKGMWSRRAQEYETKINSGDIMLLAEVLRDLARDIEDGERSYSERIIYETAVYRLASEYAIIHSVDYETAKDKIVTTAKDKVSLLEVRKDPDQLKFLREETRSGYEKDEDDEVEEDEDELDEDEEEEDEDDAPKKKKSSKK